MNFGNLINTIGYGISRGLSDIGYALHAPGMGISEPFGTQFNTALTPSTVYAAESNPLNPVNLGISSGSNNLVSPAPKSGPIGQNLPSNTQTQNNPQPQQQKSSAPSGIDWNNDDQAWGQIGQYYGGWPRGAALADFRGAFGSDYGRLQRARGVNTGGGDQQAQVPAWLSSYDQAYNPLMSALSEWQKSLVPIHEQQAQTAQTRKEQALNEIGAQEAAQGQNIGSQAQQSQEAAQRSWYQNAQAALNRFGGGAGTIGEGAQTALQQEAMRGWTDIERTKVGALAQTHNIAMGAHDKVINDTQNYLDELDSTFNNQMNQISAERAATEGQKTEAKLALINDYLKTQNQIQLDYNNKTQALLTSIGNTYAYVSALHGQMPDFNGLYQGLQSAFSQLGAGGAQTQAATPQIASQIAGNWYGLSRDQLNGLLGYGGQQA